MYSKLPASLCILGANQWSFRCESMSHQVYKTACYTLGHQPTQMKHCTQIHIASSDAWLAACFLFFAIQFLYCRCRSSRESTCNCLQHFWATGGRVCHDSLHKFPAMIVLYENDCHDLSNKLVYEHRKAQLSCIYRVQMGRFKRNF